LKLFSALCYYYYISNIEEYWREEDDGFILALRSMEKGEDAFATGWHGGATIH
jgi:hypothetical protein